MRKCRVLLIMQYFFIGLLLLDQHMIHFPDSLGHLVVKVHILVWPTKIELYLRVLRCLIDLITGLFHILNDLMPVVLRVIGLAIYEVQLNSRIFVSLLFIRAVVDGGADRVFGDPRIPAICIPTRAFLLPIEWLSVSIQFSASNGCIIPWLFAACAQLLGDFVVHWLQVSRGWQTR